MRAGGLGASAHGDGSACLPYPTNVRSTPVELMESEAGILVEYKQFVTNSGGVGQHRGGSAQEIKIRNRSRAPMYVSLIAERTKTAPRGLFGGGDGLAPKFEMEDGMPINPKGIHVIGPGAAFVVRAHGGGGYGDGALRDRALIERDLIDGYVSLDTAAS